MDIAALTRDSGSLENGMWVDGKMLPALGDAKLLVRGSDSDAYAFAMSRKQVAASDDDLVEGGQIKPEAFLRIRQELLREVVLLDWSGFTKDGEEVPFDAGLAEQWLTLPDYRPFQDLVQRASGIVNALAREKTAAAVKN